MQLKKLLIAGVSIAGLLFLSNCSNENTSVSKAQFGGYETELKWGEHLITVGGCGDCHTPKKMTAMGPVDDSSLTLSGHPAQYPLPEFDRKLLESKGMVATQTLTFWMGPWGVSYASNLTPDSTGLLAWTEEQFKTALRDGFSKGIKGNRMILPPMPIQSFKHFTDEELKAMFAYLKTINPIKNAVPQPLPPVSVPPPTPVN
jgi:hypothetical protein